MNALEILTRQKLESKTVLKCKGNEAYLKVKQRHDFFPWKLLFKAHTYKFLTQQARIWVA
jgi:hypothetical protein